MARKAHFGYGVLLIIGFLLTLVGLFTPGWRSYKGQGAPDLGLVTRYCGNGNRQVNVYDCQAWQRHTLPFEKATLGFMIVAIFLEFFSILCVFGMCSPRAQLGIPAFTTTSLAFLCLIVAILIYGTRMQYKTAYMQSQTFELLANVYLGYSYWITVIAAIFVFFASGLSGTLMSPQNVDHRMH